LVDEEIDERILNLLDLKDVFDIDYGTYKTLLREKLAEGRITGKELPREEDELLVEEFRRIKSKVGRFRIKKKNISADYVEDTKSPVIKSTKLLPQSLVPEKDLAETKSKDITDIQKLLDSILSTIRNQSKDDKKRIELDRRASEAKRRKTREASLEKGLDKVKSALSKIIAPFQSIIDKIKRFLFFTILGRAFKVFMDWASDPKNKKKLEVIGRFLKDWWPALLGAWFLFANPLGKFIRTVIGSVAKLTLRLAKFAIPKLLSFIKANPIAAIAVTGAVAAGAGEMMRQKEEKRQVTRESEKRGVKPSVVQKELDTAKSSPFAMFGEGMSNIGGYNNGGSIFSGIVGKNDGTRVSGAGEDTQYFPVAGGGGAVLAPNELVLNEKQQAQMHQDTGVHPASYVSGVQPKKLSEKITPFNTGGVIPGGPFTPLPSPGYVRPQGSFIPKPILRLPGPMPGSTVPFGYDPMRGLEGGGLVESLGRFLPGTGTVMAPRGRQWEGQGTTMQKILGMGIPGSERQTTYSAGDIARYNQLNKLRQLISGQSLYSGPYGRYMARMTQTQPTQGSFVGDAFRNFGKNVQTLKGAAKRQEEMMGQMGYKPNGYMNLSGQPIKRQGGGLIENPSTEDIMRQAHSTTVRIERGEGFGESGSGVLVRNDNGTYSVLTSGHVISGYVPGEDGNTIKIVTPDGKKHDIDPKSVRQSGVDLGSVKFSSKENYMVSRPGDPTKMKPGDSTYVGGYPIDPKTGIQDKTLRFTTGQSINPSVTDPETLKKGYTMAYSNQTQAGMSGGFVFNSRGELVGIHGSGSQMGQIQGSRAVPISSVGGTYGSTDTRNPYVNPNLTYMQLSKLQQEKAAQTYKDKTGSEADYGGPRGDQYLVGEKPDINARVMKGFVRGGLIKENTGIDIPGATADRQYLPPMAVQPGEQHYVIPKDAVQRGAVPMIDYIVAKLDPNSNPRNKGKDLIAPPTKNNIIPLPPEIIKSAASAPSKPGPGSQVVPTFSAYRETNERYESMKIYTLRSSTIGSRVM